MNLHVKQSEQWRLRTDSSITILPKVKEKKLDCFTKTFGKAALEFMAFL